MPDFRQVLCRKFAAICAARALLGDRRMSRSLFVSSFALGLALLPSLAAAQTDDLLAAELASGGGPGDVRSSWRAFRVAARVRARSLADLLAEEPQRDARVLDPKGDALRAQLTSQQLRLEARMQRWKKKKGENRQKDPAAGCHSCTPGRTEPGLGMSALE